MLASTVAALVPICEDMVEVERRHGVERLLARITRRSQETFGLAPGRAVFTLIRTVAIDRRSLGQDAAADFAAEDKIFDG